MASTSMQKWSPFSSSSSSSSAFFRRRRGWTDDVFLSFSGEDTSMDFLSALDEALRLKEVNAFKEDEEFGRENTISYERLLAIKESASSIVVLSENYASSGSRLQELAHIIGFRESLHQIVLPVFYRVDPSHVRHQNGIFEKDFLHHDEKCSTDAQRWRSAMKTIGNISGWHVSGDTSEANVIGEIVDNVSRQLRLDLLSYEENLVGIPWRAHQVDPHLSLRSNDVRFIGIWGKAGIGKTTLANAIYRSIAHEFHGSCFLHRINQLSRGGIESLQSRLLRDILRNEDIEIWDDLVGEALIEKRLCNRKVLIVLDDVAESFQLRKLAGGLHWFGPGSRIIITTRYVRVLEQHGVERRYQVEFLNHLEGSQLFYQQAIGAGYPEREFMDLCNRVVEYSEGLPLVVKVLGSSLKDGPKGPEGPEESWERTKARLKEAYDKGIYDILKVCYDRLSDLQQKIFLDIAFFLNGKNKDRVKEMLESFGFHPTIGIEVLKERSLITVSHKRIWMDDMLQELGREIVRGKPPMQPGKRSRLCLREDLNRALEPNQDASTQGVEDTEVIVLDSGEHGESHLNSKSFSLMTKLRVLDISNVRLTEDNLNLSNELRLLSWHGYPLKSLPPDFLPTKLIELIMPFSCIEELWDGTKSLDALKVINLSGSELLQKTPDLTGVPNLEGLILSGCASLYELHPSVGNLKRLTRLDMKDSKCLETLPVLISMESLKTLILSGCSKLKKCPETVGNTANLTELYLDGTAIVDLHSSIGRLTSLLFLNLRDCKDLTKLPTTIGNLTSLKTLILYGCSNLTQLPDSLGNLTCLEKLDVGETSISEAPSSLLILPNLRTLNAERLPRPFSQSLFPFRNFPRYRPNSRGLQLISSLSGFASLKFLNLSNSNLVDGDILDSLHSLSSLEILNLSGNFFVSLPQSICQLPRLRDLILINCRKLRSLPKLPLSLQNVDANDCVSLKEYYNQEKGIPSSETGMTIIRCPISSENPQSLKTDQVNLSSIHLRTVIQRYLEVHACQEESFYLTLPFPGIVECFDQKRYGSSLVITCPLDSCPENKKIALAIGAAFEFQRHENMSPEISCNFVTSLKNDDYPLKPALVFDQTECELEAPREVWVYYIPFRMIADWLGECCCIDVSIVPSNPQVTVKRCGASVLKEGDVANFMGRLVEGLFGPPKFVHSSILEHIFNRKNHQIDVNGLLEGGTRDKSSWLNALQRTIGAVPKLHASVAGKASDDGCSANATSTPADDSVLLLKKNLKCVIQRTFEDLKLNGEYYVFPQRRISGWFSLQRRRALVTIPLPEKLYNNKKWMGLAMFAVFEVDENSKISHSFSYQVESEEYTMQRPTYLRLPKEMFDGPYQLWVFFEPRYVYPCRLNEWRHLRVSFVTYSPDMKVALCGARLVDRRNLRGFVETVTDCILRSPPALHETYNDSFVEGLVSLVRSQEYGLSLVQQQDEEGQESMSTRKSMTKQTRDAEGSSASASLSVPDDPGCNEDRASDCLSCPPRESLEAFLKKSLREQFKTKFDFVIPGSEIPPFFRNRRKGDRVAVRLDATLHTNSDWIGLGVCALIYVNRHPTAIIDNLDRVVCHQLICQFAIKQGVLEPLHVHTITEDRFLWLEARRFLWLFYIPRSQYPRILQHCDVFGATLETDSPDLYVQSCGIQPVHEGDRQEIDRILLHSSTLSSPPSPSSAGICNSNF